MPPPFAKSQHASPVKDVSAARQPPPSRSTTVPMALPSKPVVIPPRSHPRPRPGPQPAPRSDRSSNGGRTRRKSRPDQPHRPNALPPAVAALLAVTAIPPPTRRGSAGSRSSRPLDVRVSIDDLIEEWREEDKDGLSLGYNSRMDILMERPDDDEDGDDEVGSEREPGLMAARSLSDSSVPSLEADERSVASWGDLSTPASPRTRTLADRREKLVSSPEAEDCLLDHPLLPPSPLDDISDAFPPNQPTLRPAPTPPTIKTSLSTPTLTATFRSNLTASLQALKYAAKSFSNFSAPSVPPDDLLTRSLLAPRFASEMRPKPLKGVPEPALRRYLNPSGSTARPVSPTEIARHLHDASTITTNTSTSTRHTPPIYDTTTAPPAAHAHALDAAAPMIQMQTYERPRSATGRKQQRLPSSSSVTSPRPTQPQSPTPPPSVRQREPRENSAFLRVIVLEMNMRRVGKLDGKAPGRARPWLPPRVGRSAGVGEAVEEGGAGIGGCVPARWVGVGLDAG